MRIAERCEKTDNKSVEEGLLLAGTHKSLKNGDVSHFTGRAWVYSNKGDLVDKRESLLERTYNPAKGEIIQREVLDKQIGGFSVETEFTVIDESLGRTEMSSRSSSKMKGTAIDKWTIWPAQGHYK